LAGAAAAEGEAGAADEADVPLDGTFAKKELIFLLATHFRINSELESKAEWLASKQNSA
jgi:hypothetical protein